MKRIKKLASLALAMVMAFAMTMTAFASNPNTAIDNKASYTITINGKTSGHTYEAYKVFAGDVATTEVEENGDTVTKKILSNVVWADGVNTTSAVDGKTLLDALKADVFTKNEDIVTKNKDGVEVLDASKVAKELASLGAESAKKFADVISGYLPTAPAARTNGSTLNEEVYVYTMTVNAPGYYLVKDQDGSNTSDMTNTDGERGSYTDYILEVVADATVNSKDTTVEWEKKILTIDENGETVIEADANKAGVNDNVTYQLSATIPDYEAYNAYEFVMVDTMSKGLDFNNDIVVNAIAPAVAPATEPTKTLLVAGTDYWVYVINNDGTPNLLTGKDAEEANALIATAKESTSENTTTFKIAFADVKSNTKVNVDDQIVATYSAKVNADAKMGVDGEPNKFHLDYSRNPNYEYPTPGPNNPNPGLPDITDSTVIGSTPDDIVITYVTKLEISKVDQDGEPLDGAEFTLTGVSKQVVAAGGSYYKEYTENVPTGGDGGYYQLTDGSYTKTAPSAAMMVEKEDQNSVTGYVELRSDEKETYNEADRVDIGDKSYRPRRTGDTGTVYVLKADNTHYYASTTKTFARMEATAPAVTERFVTMVGTSGDDGKETGKVTFNGLGEGTFTIVETVTPAGYNTIDSKTLVTKATINYASGTTEITTGNETCTWITTDGSGFEISNGAYVATIENQRGSLLPSTGGIGTTIFYVVGGILVVAAGILLVTKKRMSAR